MLITPLFVLGLFHLRIHRIIGGILGSWNCLVLSFCSSNSSRGSWSLLPAGYFVWIEIFVGHIGSYPLFHAVCSKHLFGGSWGQQCWSYTIWFHSLYPVQDFLLWPSRCTVVINIGLFFGHDSVPMITSGWTVWNMWCSCCFMPSHFGRWHWGFLALPFLSCLLLFLGDEQDVGGPGMSSSPLWLYVVSSGLAQQHCIGRKSYYWSWWCFVLQTARWRCPIIHMVRTSIPLRVPQLMAMYSDVLIHRH